jgi:hypothetical protein
MLEIHDSLLTKTGSTRKKPLQLDHAFLETFRKDVEQWQALAMNLVHMLGHAKSEAPIFAPENEELT